MVDSSLHSLHVTQTANRLTVQLSGVKCIDMHTSIQLRYKKNWESSQKQGCNQTTVLKHSHRSVVAGVLSKERCSKEAHRRRASLLVKYMTERLLISEVNNYVDPIHCMSRNTACAFGRVLGQWLCWWMYQLSNRQLVVACWCWF